MACFESASLWRAVGKAVLADQEFIGADKMLVLTQTARPHAQGTRNSAFICRMNFATTRYRALENDFGNDWCYIGTCGGLLFRTYLNVFGNVQVERRLKSSDFTFSKTGRTDARGWSSILKRYKAPFCDFVITSLALRGIDVHRQLFLRSMKFVGQGLSKAGMNDFGSRRLCLSYTSYMRERAFEFTKVKGIERYDVYHTC